MRNVVTAAAAVLVLVMAATPVLAQDSQTPGTKARVKVLAENARLRAYELTFAPGAENSPVPASSTRVVRVLAGGTLERTYPDGKKETVNYKTGEVRINQSSLPVTTKNVGSKPVRLYVVQLK
jgi:quercetin dioxygenase-like cupin family protein